VIVIEYFKNVISMFELVVNEYENNELFIKQYEDEHNDLIHEIAHGNKKNACDAYKIYAREREILSERHRLIDENSKLKELYEWCKQNSTVKGQFVKMLNSYNNLIKYIEKRAYTPRVRNDLTLRQKDIKNNRAFEGLADVIK